MSEVLVYTRKSPRYPTTMMIRREGEDTMRESRGNVSAGGFCFEGAEELPPGTRVEVLFRVPGAGFWMSGRGVILGCISGDAVVGLRGRFTHFELGDPDLLHGWLLSIHRLEEHGTALDDRDELTLFSTTLG